MLWILYATAAQALSATVSIMDRFMVRTGKVANPFLYALYVSILSAFAITAFALGDIPGLRGIFPSVTGVDWTPSLSLLSVTVAAGFTFFIGIYFVYDALRTMRASDVMPVVGAVSAVTALGLEAMMGVRFGPFVLAGVALIVVGTLLISRMNFTTRLRYRIFAAGILFGFHAITLTMLFDVANFDTGFFWSRATLVILAASAYFFIYVPYHRVSKIERPKARAHAKGFAWVLGNKSLSGVSSILILRALETGSATVVQALGGLQFVFLLIFGITLGSRYQLAGEQHSRHELHLKTIAILLVSIGFGCLFI